jgi:mannose-6-phosphate isomerase-like protein (cupin superfamily)
MVIKSANTSKIPIPGGTIWNYPLPSEDIGISYQELNGPGPLRGWYLNTVCHEIYFVISGTAVFFIKDKKYDVEQNDVIIVEPNSKHKIDAKNLKYITITKPDWYEGQYQEIEEG